MLIYISGPITLGDSAKHVHEAIKSAEYVIEMGHHVVLPHLTQLWHIVSPKPWSYWLKNDLALLKRCDAVLRLPGESQGADREVKMAQEHKIPVYYDVNSIPVAEELLNDNR